MFMNYFVVSFRNLLKYKFFSLINIAGLSIGLSAVLLISLFIWDEVTFDSYLNKNGNIYKLELHTDFPGRGARDNPGTAGAIAPALVAEYPEMVLEAARLIRQVATVTVGDRAVSERIYYGDPGFFSIFELNYVEGNASTALPDTSSVSISETVARRYFGDTPALGQTISLDNGNDYRVGAVFREFPENTHIRPQFIFPITAGNNDLVSEQTGWWSIGYRSYVKATEGVTAADLRTASSAIVDRYLEAPAEGLVMSNQYNYNVLPMADVHFETAAPEAGNPLMLKGFAAIAFVILTIATFNFMNMSISRTMVRAREVAVRKVFGAGQSNIINLLMNETLLTVLISLVLAVVITELSLVWFNDFVAKLMNLGTLATPEFTLGLVGLVLLVSMGAGFYPAKIMAGLRPATVLRGGRSASKSMSRLAKILVTAQFAVAIGLMITATVIYQQIKYSQSMDAGYQKENLLLVSGINHPSVRSVQTSLKDRIAGLPGVTDVTLVDQAPGGRYGWMEGIQTVDGIQQDQPIAIRGVSIGDNFTGALGTRLVAGRALTTERAADINRPLGTQDTKEAYNIMVNEQALRTLGLGSPEEAIGKTLSSAGTYTIVGVVQDYLWGTFGEPPRGRHQRPCMWSTRMFTVFLRYGFAPVTFPP